MILAFRDNWFYKVANAPVEVRIVLEIVDRSPFPSTFDVFEEHILNPATDNPLAAYLQLYEAIIQQLQLTGRALGMKRTEVWNVPVGVKLLRKHIQQPHQAVEKMFIIFEKYAELYTKTIMLTGDDESVNDHDIM